MFLLQSFHLLCCAFLICTDFPLHLHRSGTMSYGRIVSQFQIVWPEHVCYGNSQQKGSEPHHICQVRLLNACCLYRLLQPLCEVAPENLVWKHASPCINQQLAYIIILQIQVYTEERCLRDWIEFLDIKSCFLQS